MSTAFTSYSKSNLSLAASPRFCVTGVDEFEFDIFNRWGQQIFKTEDPFIGWDGSYKGKPCQEDVYVWLIKFTNVVTRRHEEHYGNVLLMQR